MENIEIRGQTYVGMDTVSIPKADGSGDAEFILPEGEEEITENGEYDVTRKKTARVNVPASGTDDYTALSNKPAIGGVTLQGNKTPAQLGLVAAQEGAGLIPDTERQQIQDNADDIAELQGEQQQQGTDLQQLQDDVDAIEAKIPNQASAQNQLADKDFVNSSINSAAAFFRGSFASRAALLAVAWQTSDPSAANYVNNNDYAYVADDESHDDEAWRYIYVLHEGGQNNGWQPQFRVNESPLTAAQVAALNSGATAALIAQITANETAIGQKYTKPSTGIPKSDLASAVQDSLGKADTALQAVPSTYRTAADQDTIDEGKADKVIEVTISTAGAVTQALDAGKIYHFTGALTALTITAADPSVGDYQFDFHSGETAPTLSVPSAWVMPDNFVVAQNGQYRLSVSDGYCEVEKWSDSHSPFIYLDDDYGDFVINSNALTGSPNAYANVGTEISSFTISGRLKSELAANASLKLCDISAKAKALMGSTYVTATLSVGNGKVVSCTFNTWQTSSQVSIKNDTGAALAANTLVSGTIFILRTL